MIDEFDADRVSPGPCVTWRIFGYDVRVSMKWLFRKTLDLSETIYHGETAWKQLNEPNAREFYIEMVISFIMNNISNFQSEWQDELLSRAKRQRRRTMLYVHKLVLALSAKSSFRFYSSTF